MIYVPFIIYVQIYNLKLIKTGISTETSSVKKDQQPNILAMFARPQKLTEEEVSISKEKKICLVCKGNVSGINYICTECGAFYCMKCSQAISKLENECWACNSPIDKSKPFKPFKKEEVDIEISEEPQKKPKTKK